MVIISLFTNYFYIYPSLTLIHLRFPELDILEDVIPAAGYDPFPILLIAGVGLGGPPLPLDPPLFYRRSTQIIDMLSEPIPSFKRISSNVSGQISSSNLWLQI